MKTLLDIVSEWLPAIGGAALTLAVFGITTYWLLHERPSNSHFHQTTPQADPPGDLPS